MMTCHTTWQSLVPSYCLKGVIGDQVLFRGGDISDIDVGVEVNNCTIHNRRVTGRQTPLNVGNNPHLSISSECIKALIDPHGQGACGLFPIDRSTCGGNNVRGLQLDRYTCYFTIKIGDRCTTL
ncbi:MAG: hypothetical protein ABW108_12795 [Candidatus Thiodiazotropha sp. 6PLUC10]